LRFWVKQTAYWVRIPPRGDSPGAARRTVLPYYTDLLRIYENPAAVLVVSGPAAGSFIPTVYPVLPGCTARSRPRIARAEP